MLAEDYSHHEVSRILRKCPPKVAEMLHKVQVTFHVCVCMCVSGLNLGLRLTGPLLHHCLGVTFTIIVTIAVTGLLLGLGSGLGSGLGLGLK